MGGITSGQTDKVTITQRRSSEVPEGNGFIFFGKVLPVEMCEEVFLDVPAIDVVRSVTRVCKNWHHLLTNLNFWLRKAKREGFQISTDVERRLIEEDPNKAVYVLQGLCTHKIPINRNLIKNPSGVDGLQHWWVHHGGDKLKVECPPIGSDKIPEEACLPTQHCFVSSFTACTRSQTISLKDHHVEPWVMDILRPEIHVSEWVSARWDCDSKSLTIVEVFGKNESPAEYTIEWSSQNDGVVKREWYKLNLVAECPTGLSTIKFTNTSSDEQFWAGHYGAKTAGSTVILHL